MCGVHTCVLAVAPAEGQGKVPALRKLTLRLHCPESPPACTDDLERAGVEVPERERERERERRERGQQRRPRGWLDWG